MPREGERRLPPGVEMHPRFITLMMETQRQKPADTDLVILFHRLNCLGTAVARLPVAERNLRQASRRRRQATTPEVVLGLERSSYVGHLDGLLSDPSPVAYGVDWHQMPDPRSGLRRQPVNAVRFGGSTMSATFGTVNTTNDLCCDGHALPAGVDGGVQHGGYPLSINGIP
jgi:hypothetical protein